MGRELAAAWARFFVNLVGQTISIASGGSMTGMIMGLILLTLALTIAAVPLLVLSAWWLIATVVGMFRQDDAAGSTS